MPSACEGICLFRLGSLMLCVVKKISLSNETSERESAGLQPHCAGTPASNVALHLNMDTTTEERDLRAASACDNDGTQSACAPTGINRLVVRTAQRPDGAPKGASAGNLVQCCVQLGRRFACRLGPWSSFTQNLLHATSTHESEMGDETTLSDRSL